MLLLSLSLSFRLKEDYLYRWLCCERYFLQNQSGKKCPLQFLPVDLKPVP